MNYLYNYIYNNIKISKDFSGLIQYTYNIDIQYTYNIDI